MTKKNKKAWKAEYVRPTTKGITRKVRQAAKKEK